MSFSYFKLFYLNIFYSLNYIFNAYYICFVGVIMIWLSVYMCLPLHMLLFNKHFRINLKDAFHTNTLPLAIIMLLVRLSLT